jgi:predicted DNA-binding ribbon-helix-helix protein
LEVARIGYPPPMTARPVKRSLTLHGHRTSVSLEAAFWDAFRALAAERGVPLNQLAAEIDDARAGDEGLASAIRVFVLYHHQAMTSAND